MSDNEKKFSEQLGEVLSQKNESFTKPISLMNEQMRGCLAGIQGIFKMLIEKGVVKEDPYQYEQHISKLHALDTTPLTEKNKDEEFSRKFVQYIEQFDLLTNFYKFHPQEMSLKEMKLIMSVVTYINWKELSSTSSSSMTRCAAELIFKMRRTDDRMLNMAINNSLSVLKEGSIEIRKTLKEITTFLREQYKYNIRVDILPGMEISPIDAKEKQDDVLRRIRVEFSRQMKGAPFYKELILEILAENYSSDAQREQKGLLEKLAVNTLRTNKKKKDDPEKKLKILLNRCVGDLTLLEPQLELIISKVRDNKKILQSKKLSFGAKFAAVVSSIFGGKKNKSIVYEISYTDPFTSLRKTESLNLNDFQTRLQKKYLLARNLIHKNSAAYEALFVKSDNEIYEFLMTTISDVKNIYRKLAGLDEYFKKNVDPVERKSIRGLKVEINTLKGILGTLIKDANEYKALKDEIDQFKKLGVDIRKN